MTRIQSNVNVHQQLDHVCILQYKDTTRRDSHEGWTDGHGCLLQRVLLASQGPGTLGHKELSISDHPTRCIH